MLDEKRISSLKRRYGNRVAKDPARRHGPGRRMSPREGGRPRNSGETVRRLMSYLKKDRLGIAVAFLCVITGTVTNLAGAYMLRPIINRYIVPVDGSRGVPSGLFGGLLVMAAVYLISVAANYAQSRIMLTIAQNALQRIREDLFVRLQKLPLRFYDTQYGDKRKEAVSC